MVPSLSTVRSTPSRTSLAPYKRQITLHGSSISLPRNGACTTIVKLTYSASGHDGEQSEIIFMRTRTSARIPRVSCLTDPLKKCPVCLKALEPGDKNRRLNTSILIQYTRPSGSYNILIDAGKVFLSQYSSMVSYLWDKNS
ncbi:hypothetical protein SLE2022_384980 [Rubroshorea leprosula]